MSQVSIADAADAARLVALGLRPKQRPSRDVVYADLVRRYEQDPVFAELAEAIASGLDLAILDVGQRAGAVLAAMIDSPFEVKIDDYAKRVALQNRKLEKTLHGLIHLAIAALAFPRPQDLADDAYVGRVAVDHVDQVVREACRKLQERADTAEVNSDPLEGSPLMERAWRAYSRRAPVAATGDGRHHVATTRAMISKAMRFLAEHGFLSPVNGDDGDTYRTTVRYQIQVRELAAEQAFDELIALGVIGVGRPTASLSTTANGESDV